MSVTKASNSLFIYKVVIAILGSISGVLLLLLLILYIVHRRKVYPLITDAEAKETVLKSNRARGSDQKWIPVMNAMAAKNSLYPCPIELSTIDLSGGENASINRDIRAVQPVNKQYNRRMSVPALACTIPVAGQPSLIQESKVPSTKPNYRKGKRKSIIPFSAPDIITSDNVESECISQSDLEISDQLGGLHMDRPTSDLGSPDEQTYDNSMSPACVLTRVPRLSSFHTLAADQLSATLYQDQDPLGSVPLNVCGLGLLCFSLHYNMDQKILTVTVHRAFYLSSKRIKEKGNFYVKLRLDTQDFPSAASCASLDTLNHELSATSTLSASSQASANSKIKCPRTEVKTAFRNPEFEASFEFIVKPDDLNRFVLQLMVKESLGMLGKGTLIGIVKFRLREAKLDEGVEILEEVWRDVVALDKESVSQGEMLLSLAYNPKTGRLHVGIMHCRGLSVKDSTNGSVYARVSLMSAEHLIKTKETSHVKRNLSNPEFPEGEMLHFKLDPSNVQAVSCVIFICINKGRLGQSHLLGRCVVGPVMFADGESLEHWTLITTNTDEVISRWHNLI